MDKRTIGSFLSALRKANGMTQKELAERLNVSDKAVSRWERDESYPDLTMIPIIADIFGVTSDELLRGQRMTAQEQESGCMKTERSEREVRNIAEKSAAQYLNGVLISVGIVLTAYFVLLLTVTVIEVGFIGWIMASAVAFVTWWAALIFVLFFAVSLLWRNASPGCHADAAAPSCRKIRAIRKWTLVFLAPFGILIFSTANSVFKIGFFIYLVMTVTLFVCFRVNAFDRIAEPFRTNPIFSEKAKLRFRRRFVLVSCFFILVFGLVFYVGKKTKCAFFSPGKSYTSVEEYTLLLENEDEDDGNNSSAFVTGLFGRPKVYNLGTFGNRTDPPETDEMIVTNQYEFRYSSGDVNRVKYWNTKVYMLFFRTGSSSSPVRAISYMGSMIGYTVWFILLIVTADLYFISAMRLWKKVSMAEKEELTKKEE